LIPLPLATFGLLACGQQAVTRSNTALSSSRDVLNQAAGRQPFLFGPG
jgi:hypothetical protein